VATTAAATDPPIIMPMASTPANKKCYLQKGLTIGQIYYYCLFIIEKIIYLKKDANV
jgi:hypothetical protein